MEGRTKLISSILLKGSISGNQVSFDVKTRKHKASFTGTVNGDKMTGTTEQGASWTAPIAAFPYRRPWCG